MRDEQKAGREDAGALRAEIARDEALRREMWEKGERVDRPTSPKSVLGYELSEPEPSPLREKLRALIPAEERQPLPDEWNYRIEPYRGLLGGGGWTPVKEAEATVWFGFRERGEDHRCFGVFPSRGDAEKAMRIIQEREQQIEPSSAPEQGRTRGR